MEHGHPWNGDYVHEELFRKKTGEFFIAGEGGPMTDYRVWTGRNSFSGHVHRKIVPLTIREAKAWVEEHLSEEEYCDLFGEPEE